VLYVDRRCNNGALCVDRHCNNGVLCVDRHSPPAREPGPSPARVPASGLLKIKKIPHDNAPKAFQRRSIH
jgi:hypothetical protein